MIGVAVVLTALATISLIPANGQNENEKAKRPPQDANFVGDMPAPQVVDPTEIKWPEDKRLPRVLLTEKEPPPTVLKQVNGVFEEIVGYMAAVLFWSPVTETTEYVQLDEEIHYIRPAKSSAAEDYDPYQRKDSFVRIGPDGTEGEEELTVEEVKRLEARGLLVAGLKTPIRPGIYNGDEVEFITLPKGKPTKYRLVDGAFYRETGMQENISREAKDTLTMAIVQKLAAQGKLKLNASTLKNEVVLALSDSKHELADLADVLAVEQATLSPLLEELEKEALVEATKNGTYVLTSVGESKATNVANARKDASKKTHPFILTESKARAPLVVLWLAAGSVIFTVIMGFFNIRGFKHAIDIVRGKYDNPDEPGEVTHFQALSSALSATVGLGNIAGVTIAMTLGGPGAFFWMLLCGFFGMTSKFVESTCGQMYRQVNKDGTVRGGPMEYLYSGLKELGMGPIGFVLAIVFAVMCILASFGGGNMFQANQSGEQLLGVVQQGSLHELDELSTKIKDAATAGDDAQVSKLQQQRTDLKKSRASFEFYFRVGYGLVLATLVGLVIVGGIKRIGAAASKVVPTMCLLYIAACMFVILWNITEIPALAASIFTEAFSPAAFGGGILGVLIIGVQRAAFSNEAGVGSAAIAHSAAKTDEPVREGSVAMLGPFIDTIVVCSMTALVVLITGAWSNSEWVIDKELAGAPLLSQAFSAEFADNITFLSVAFPWILAVAIVMFAYSTLVSWSYYGEKCWERLFGQRSTIIYKALYLGACFLGAIVNLGAVLDFSDMMILSMAFPNVFGLLLLSPKIRNSLIDYWRRYQEGKFKTFD